MLRVMVALLFTSKTVLVILVDLGFCFGVSFVTTATASYDGYPALLMPHKLFILVLTNVYSPDLKFSSTTTPCLHYSNSVVIKLLLVCFSPSDNLGPAAAHSRFASVLFIPDCAPQIGDSLLCHVTRAKIHVAIAAYCRSRDCY
jgi:hypothetical protein